MGKYTIPEPYCWDESFQVFYAQLDQEHQGLFQAIFACAGARGDQGKFDALYKLLADHFAYEEGEMKSKNYKNYSSHKGLHDGFLGTVKGMSVPLSDGNIHAAKEWLVDHIKDIDFQYKGKLN